MIALDGVSKTYPTVNGRRVVLDNASAVFESGCNFGILGVNGAGKSTLIRLLAGSETPDRGRIRRDGRVSFPLGYSGTFHGSLSGRENVAFIARIYGASVRKTISYVADFSEIDQYFDMPVNTYSAGMKARLAFGTCLAIDFDTYLIDEVTEIGDRFGENAPRRFASARGIPTSSSSPITAARPGSIATVAPSWSMANCACSTISAARSIAIAG